MTKAEAEIQYTGRVYWLTTNVSKNWVYNRTQYENAPWENINNPAQLAVSMTAHVGEDGPVVITVGVTKSTGGPLFTPVAMGSTRIRTCAELHDDPLAILTGVAQPVRDLLQQLNIVGCWQVFAAALRAQENAASEPTEV